MAITRLGGANAITGIIPVANGGSGRTAVTGNILQVVTGNITTPVSVNNSSNTAWNETGLEATITPTSSSNKILLILNVSSSSTNNSNGGVWRSIGGASATLVNAGDISSNRTSGIGTTRADWDSNSVINVASQFLDTTNTTSAVKYTFQVRVWNNSTFYLNRSVNDADGEYTPRPRSTITLMEIAG
jgi:hypothetical protein